MENIVASRARTRKSTLLYGYRITGVGKDYKPFALPTIFAPDTPTEWETVKSDKTIIRATLRRRNRVIDQHTGAVQA